MMQYISQERRFLRGVEVRYKDNTYIPSIRMCVQDEALHQGSAIDYGLSGVLVQWRPNLTSVCAPGSPEVEASILVNGSVFWSVIFYLLSVCNFSHIQSEDAQMPRRFSPTSRSNTSFKC